jgi:hypothetical protein
VGSMSRMGVGGGREGEEIVGDTECIKIDPHSLHRRCEEFISFQRTIFISSCSPTSHLLVTTSSSPSSVILPYTSTSGICSGTASTIV